MGYDGYLNFSATYSAPFYCLDNNGEGEQCHPGRKVKPTCNRQFVKDSEAVLMAQRGNISLPQDLYISKPACLTILPFLLPSAF